MGSYFFCFYTEITVGSSHACFPPWGTSSRVPPVTFLLPGPTKYTPCPLNCILIALPALCRVEPRGLLMAVAEDGGHQVASAAGGQVVASR